MPVREVSDCLMLAQPTRELIVSAAASDEAAEAMLRYIGVRGLGVDED